MSYKNNAISSDDPQAIEKLTEKLQKCEELQTLMKKANAHYKKYGTVKGCEGISDEKAENMEDLSLYKQVFFAGIVVVLFLSFFNPLWFVL